MTKSATAKEDAKIKAVGCFGACFAGYRGMDRCAKCDGVGSQLIIPSGKLFQNTKRGYDMALRELRATSNVARSRCRTP